MSESPSFDEIGSHRPPTPEERRLAEAVFNGRIEQQDDDQAPLPEVPRTPRGRHDNPNHQSEIGPEARAELAAARAKLHRLFPDSTPETKLEQLLREQAERNARERAYDRLAGRGKQPEEPAEPESDTLF